MSKLDGFFGLCPEPLLFYKEVPKINENHPLTFSLQLWHQQHLRTSLEAELARDNGNARCFVIAAPATCRSSLATQGLTHTSTRHTLWKGSCCLFPHPWKVTTLTFKVASLASGPKKEMCSSGKSPVLGGNSSSGSSLGFCKDFRILSERTNPERHAQKGTSFQACVIFLHG